MRTAVVMNVQSMAETPTLAAALQLGAELLSQAGVESARLDAEVLLRHVLQSEPEDLFVRLRERISPLDQKRFHDLLERRAAREPLAYITGRKEFWSLDFIVTPAVLIPRPETELLVEVVIDYAREHSPGFPLMILDIGAGSGAIAVSLAKHLPDARVSGSDISAAALRVAEANAKRHGVESRTRFFESDLFDALTSKDGIFDVIVSNPPYVRRAELSALAPEISHWEPAVALDGGADGLAYYRKIIDAAPKHLRDGGRVFLETGSELGEAVVALFESADRYLPARIYQDYAGLNRVVEATVA